MMARESRPINKGDVVKVVFLDHVESGKAAKPERFFVYGRVVSIDSRALVIGCWVYPSTRRKTDHNNLTFTILRSCISSVTHLEEA